jgi:hypothetical protein
MFRGWLLIFVGPSIMFRSRLSRLWQAETGVSVFGVMTKRDAGKLAVRRVRSSQVLRYCEKMHPHAL